MIYTFRIAIISTFFILLMSSYGTQRINAEETIVRIAGDESLPPFSYLDENDEWVGFSIDLMKAISRMEGIQVQYLPMEHYKAVEALENGQVDAVMGLKYTAERDEIFEFSKSYFTVWESLIVPKEEEGIQYLSDLKEKVVAIQSDHVSFDFLKDVRNVHMNIAISQPEAIDLLTLGRADVFVGNRWTAKFYLESIGKKNQFKIITHPIQPADYAFAVKDGNSKLLNKLNNGLLELKTNGNYDELYNKWFNEPSSSIKRMKSIVITLLCILAITGFVLILGVVWNKRLKQEVTKHTKALKKANIDLEIKQQEIANQGAFKDQILNNVPNGIVTFDNNWNITSMNKEAKQILTTKKGWYEHVIIKEALQYLREQKGGQVTGEVEFEQNGIDMFLTYHLRLLLNASNQRIGFLLIFENRTEEKILQERLAIQEKMRALGQLSAGVAHEMRNPLTSIKTFIELLPIKYENPSFREAIKEHVPAEIDRLNHIIEDLLDYSRPKVPEKQLFKMKEWLESIIVLFEPTLRNEKIHFTTWVDSHLTIYADKQQLKQVLVNMILNAIDAMKDCEVKELSILGHSDNNMSIIRIVDTGLGMKKQVMEKCYDPFFTTKAEGVGLGMTICFNLVKENSGVIEIDSQYGKGTSIRILLPQTI